MQTGKFYTSYFDHFEKYHSQNTNVYILFKARGGFAHNFHFYLFLANTDNPKPLAMMATAMAPAQSNAASVTRLFFLIFGHFQQWKIVQKDKKMCPSGFKTLPNIK